MKHSLLSLLILILPLTLFGQGNPVDLDYQVPPEEVVRIVDAAPLPGVSLSPDRSMMMLMHRRSLPTIEDLSQPELRLAGIRMNPNTNGRSGAVGFLGLTLKNLDTDMETDITGIPENARIGSVSWSPNGRYFAFTNTVSDGIQLWVGSTESASVSQVTGIRVNDAFYGAAMQWLPDSQRIIVRSVPDDRGEEPVVNPVPTGPIIQQNLGRSAPARTYQDMLQNDHDEALFDYYFTSQLVMVDVRTGTQTKVGEPGLYRSQTVAPNGNLLLVASVHRPYSYYVPAFRFPTTTEVWNLNGDVVHTVAEIPLQDEIPIGFGSTSVGPRSITWRNDAPAELMWAEAQDEGNPRIEVEHRDFVYLQNYPFEAEPRVFARLENRYSGVMWGHDGLALVIERWFSDRNEKVWMLQPGDPNAEQVLLRDRNYEDIFNDPGSPVMTVNETGNAVLLTADDGYTMFLSGNGSSPDGNFPFLDRFNPHSGESERLWQSVSPYFERVTAVLDNQATEIITNRQSENEPANFFRLNLTDNTRAALTTFEHPNPELMDVHREIISYEREDGIPLTGTLFLPPDYDKEKDGKLPLVVWAYPREFRSADAAGQQSFSPYTFNNISFWGPQWLVTQGYAVLDNATMPIVGEGDKQPNDTFVEQLIMNAEAAVQAVAEMGIADPDRAAIGGHSYGAFMTANLLAHSDIFRAGIARSGAYNRSLTPFGFQREERTIWDDTDLYIRMSPFFHAHTLTTPILIIHGAEDNNSGTFPIQSERLYQAIQGLGGTARLVMLPNESHGYRARESVLHMLWETLEWLDEYVKNASAEQAMAE